MNSREISFAIQSMTCANCAITIERALARLDGVIAARVNYASERATITFDPARVSAEQIVRAVKQNGFGAQTRRVTRSLVSVWRGERIAGFASHTFIHARADWLAQTVELEWLADVGDAQALPRARVVALIARAPVCAGVLAAFGMFALYVLILTGFQSFAHALQQARQDWFWIGLVTFGFGAQIGLYSHLRLIVSATNAASAAAATGAGTTTSTLGMVACCAHHLTDLAPLVALTGASSLSGAIAFLNEWKYAFIAFGLVMNALGIVITLRTIRKSRAHLNASVMNAVH
jgi:copper chaperone CopZ